MKLALKIAQYIFILALPFGLFYWLSPLTGERTIGNDYPMFHIDQQMELQYAIEHGSFPLYVPGFAGGHTAAALTLGQLFHPQSHLATLYPGYWNGKGLEANTFLRLVMLGIAQLILFILLNRLRLRPEISFVISFITVYNLRMLDMFRYGASLENYLGYLFVCAAMCYYYLKPTRVVGPLGVIFSTYLLVCGGHPQMMYLGMLGVGLVVLLIPHSLAAICDGVEVNRPRAVRFYLRMGLFLCLGVLMASAYTLPFYFEFIGENATRVGRNYNWSLAYSDSVGGTFNSFFKPLHSVVMNTFGSSALIVLALFLPLVYAVRRNVPKAIIFITAAFAVVFLIGLGRYTPVHFVFWKFFPLANVFRIPGRIYLILPFIFVFMLAWIFKDSANEGRDARWLPKIPPMFWVIVVAAAVYLWYNLHLIHIIPPPTHYIPSRIKAYPFGVDTFIFWVGFASLVLAALYTLARRWWKPLVGALLCLTVIAQCGVELRYGTWVTKNHSKATLEKRDQNKRAGLTYKASPGYGMESPLITEQIKKSILDPKLARFYRSFRTFATSDQAYQYLATKRTPDEAVLVGKRPEEPVPDCSPSAESCPSDTVTLKMSSFNRLVFEVKAAESGVFTLSFPFSKRWQVTVDGSPTTAHRTNGYLIGVPVPKGTHLLELKYWSTPTVVGVAVSLLVLFGLIVFFSFRYTPWKIRIPIVAIAAIILGGGYTLWFNSLYTGDNLETRYTWRSPPPAKERNIAFGRTTRMSSTKSLERPYDFYAGLAVDGDRTSRGFVTGPKKKNPWWEVDLGGIRAVREIVVHAPNSKTRKHLPLKVMVATKRTKFKTHEVLETREESGPWHIDMKGVKTRFIRLQSSGKGSLSLNEVEVFEAE